MGIPADICSQNRQACNDRLQQDCTGVLNVGGMDQKVRAQQEPGNIVPSLENLHPRTNAETTRQGDEGVRCILTDGNQPGSRAQLIRQGCYRVDDPVQTFGAKTRSHHQQQDIVAGNGKFCTQPGPDGGAVGGCHAIPGYTWR